MVRAVSHVPDERDGNVLAGPPSIPSLDCGASGSGAVSKSGGYAVTIRTSTTAPITARKA
jgi:hypothetical protein